MAEGFVKLMRGNIATELLKDHQALALLTAIAIRANRETGQAMIGDWKVLGFASEAAYRRTKNRVLRSGYATFKATNKGTLASLTNTGLYDINIVIPDEQSDEQSDDQAPKHPTTKAATNKKLKKLKEKEIKELGIDLDLWDEYLKTRKSLKAPNSELALTRVINKITNLKSEGHDPSELVAEANERGWKTVYPPKGNSNGNIQRAPTASDFIDWPGENNSDAVRDIGDGVPEFIPAGSRQEANPSDDESLGLPPANFFRRGY